MEIHKVWHRSRHVFTFSMSCFGELLLGKCRYVIRRLSKTCKIAGAALLPQFLFPRGHCRYNPANYCKISWPGSCLHGIYIGFRPPLKQLTFVSKHRWQTVICRGGGKQECLKHGNSQGLAPFKTCFYISLCLVLGNCFWENVGTSFRRFSKTCKIAG